MNFHIAEQLPEAANCRESFANVIGEYINAIYLRMKEQDMNQTVIVPMSQPNIGLVANEEVAEFGKEILLGDISQQLFQ